MAEETSNQQSHPTEQQKQTPPPDRAAAAAADPEGSAAEKLRIALEKMVLEIKEAAGRGLKDEGGLIEKAEKEVTDAVAAYVIALQQKHTPPPDPAVAAAADPEGSAAEKLQIAREIKEAAGKGLKDDGGLIEKAEKEVTDAVAAYITALPTLKLDESVESFRTHEWQCIKNASNAKRVDEIIKAADDAIAAVETLVEKYAGEKVAAAPKSEAADRERDNARAALTDATGSQKKVMDMLKTAKDCAAKSIKESAAHPATSYMFGTLALIAAEVKKYLPSAANLKAFLEKKLQTFVQNTEAARTARETLDAATIKWTHAKKRLVDLKASREDDIAKEVALLDAVAPPTAKAP